jgi:2-dehydro-3-deoxyphosphogluconate aldolase / (4S)-4-hydroxy-2-oxoglutarate aldolase
MQKIEIIQQIVESGLVVVVRADTEELAGRIASACADGGVRVMEITFTVPGAARVIESLAPCRNYCLGAGTVLDPETARIAILAGAKFIVSPSFNPATARLCQRYQVPYLPGAGSVTEIVTAMEGGGDIIKVFPGETLGPAFIKATLAALPHAPLMPTGGVSIDNVSDWIKAGCVAVGAGGSLTASAKTGDFAGISILAKKFLDRIREARAK